jgi:hypothetical protein
MRKGQVRSSRFGCLENREMRILCAQTRIRLTEQRAINSNLRAEGNEDFAAMAGIGGGEMYEAGGA